MAKGIEVKTNRAGFRAVMQSAGVRQLVGYEAARAKGRAEAVSGLRFGCGVDVGKVSCHGWVGATAVDSRTGKVNRGLLKKQEAALSQALHGV